MLVLRLLFCIPFPIKNQEKITSRPLHLAAGTLNYFGPFGGDDYAAHVKWMIYSDLDKMFTQLIFTTPTE